MENEKNDISSSFGELCIYAVDEAPACIAEAAAWLSDKWGIALAAYTKSMEQSLASESGIPRWYLARDGRGHIAGGAGVIENDFHKRPDLRPNLCALYVEPKFRGQGLARRLLERACRDLAVRGTHEVYLLTTHTGLYERLGWTFHCFTEDDEGGLCRLYRHSQ